MVERSFSLRFASLCFGRRGDGSRWFSFSAWVPYRRGCSAVVNVWSPADRSRFVRVYAYRITPGTTLDW